MTTNESAAPERLLPCPFCGSNDVEREGWVGMDVDHEKISGPACNGCGATADSVSAWNRRALIDTPAPPTPAEPAGDTLREALQRADTLFHFDLRKMIEWGPDYNQAVKDVADRVRATLAAAPAPQPAPSYEDLLDTIDGLESDLDNAVETAIKRGAIEWGRLNYPDHPALKDAQPPAPKRRLQYTACDDCGNVTLPHDEAIWTTDGASYCPNCRPKIAAQPVVDAPQPTPVDREALVEEMAQIIDHPSVYMGGPSRNALRIANAIADALLARGLRLPSVDVSETTVHAHQGGLMCADDTQTASETMAWGIIKRDGEIIAGGFKDEAHAVRFMTHGESVVRVAIRVLDDAEGEA